MKYIHLQGDQNLSKQVKWSYAIIYINKKCYYSLYDALNNASGIRRSYISEDRNFVRNPTYSTYMNVFQENIFPYAG